jgi:hypothetical protein
MYELSVDISAASIPAITTPMTLWAAGGPDTRAWLAC